MPVQTGINDFKPHFIPAAVIGCLHIRLFTMANPKLFRTIDKAVSEYNMIEAGDRILIAASGGKDSTALTEYFAARLQRRHPIFEAAALHIATDIGSEFAPELAARFKSWGIDLTVKTISVLDRLKTGK